VIAAWGKNGSFKNRDAAVCGLLCEAKLHCLHKNDDGSPEHPLYIPADTQPIPYP